MIWALCATGMQAALARSTDGGRTCSPLRPDQGIVNSARLAAASATTAVVATLAHLLVTTDGGASFRPAKGPAVDAGGGWVFVGFTDPTHGVAISVIDDRRTTVLWQTTDGGRVWSPVTIKG